MAYKSRLKIGEALEKQWENFPDSKLEKRKFAICKSLVEVTQTLIEQSKNKTNKNIEQTPEPKPMEENQRVIDPCDNHTLNIEKKHREQRELDNKIVEDTEDQQDVSKVRDSWPEILWNQVQNAKHGSKTFDSAPFDELDVKKPPLHFDLTLLYGDMGSQQSQQS